MRLDWTLVPLLSSSFLLLDWDSVYIMGVAGLLRVLALTIRRGLGCGIDEEKVSFVLYCMIHEAKIDNVMIS